MSAIPLETMVADLVGQPFKEGARGPNEFDCWGLVREVAKRSGTELPDFDRGLSALIGDLDDRGLLADTLVLCMGEFGRTPLAQGVKGKKEINYEALGRGHNSYGWSLWLAGGT